MSIIVTIAPKSSKQKVNLGKKISLGGFSFVCVVMLDVRGFYPRNAWRTSFIITTPKRRTHSSTCSSSKST